MIVKVLVGVGVMVLVKVRVKVLVGVAANEGLKGFKPPRSKRTIDRNRIDLCDNEGPILNIGLIMSVEIGVENLNNEQATF